MRRDFFAVEVFRLETRWLARWQAFAARTGYAAFVLSVAWLELWALPEVVDKSILPGLGRRLFFGMVYAQSALTVIVVPLIAATTLREEIDAHTAELLLLARWSSAAVVAAKMLARLVSIVLSVGASVPALFLAIGFGGVSLPEGIAAVANLAALAALMTGCGLFFAMFTSRPGLVALPAGVYALFSCWIIPATCAAVAGDEAFFPRLSLLSSHLAADLSALAAPLSIAPALAVTFTLAAASYHRAIYSRDLELPFVDEWHRFAWRFVWTALFAVIARWICARRPGLAPLGVAFDLWLQIAFSVLQALAAWASLQGMARGLQQVDAFLSKPAHVGVFRPEARPVLSKELQHGPLGLAIGAGVLIAGLFPFFAIADQQELLTVTSAGLVCVLGAWFGASAIAEEQVYGTLDLLLVSPLRGWQIVSEKIAGILLSLSPLAAVTLLISLPRDHLGEELPQAALAAVWACAVWAQIVALAVALGARLQRTMAVGISLAAPLAVILVSSAAVPEGGPLETLLSSGLWLGGAWAASRWAARRLKP